MAIVGNSDIIVLPNALANPNDIEYAVIQDTQKQLLAVNEGSTNLWIFNTDTNLWVNISSSTENVGGEQEVYDDEAESSYRDVRTFNTRDSSMRILQRENTLDFRAVGHSLNDFKIADDIFLKPAVIRNQEVSSKTVGTKIKVLTLNGNKITTDLPLDKNLDFNPTKEGYNWIIRLDKELVLQNGNVNYRVDKYSNGTFYITKLSGVDIQINDTITLWNPFINYKYILPKLDLNSFEFFLSGSTLFGQTIHSIEPIATFFHNGRYIMLFVMRRTQNPVTWYLSYTTSLNLIDWTTPTNSDIIYQNTANYSTVTHFYNNFSFDGSNLNHHIISFVCKSSPPYQGYILVLDSDLNLIYNSSLTVSKWITRYKTLKYKGKIIYIGLSTGNNGLIKDRGSDFLLTDEPFDNYQIVNPTTLVVIANQPTEAFLTKNNTSYSFTNCSIQTPGDETTWRQGFYSFLKVNDKLSRVLSRNIFDILDFNGFSIVDNQFRRWDNNNSMLISGQVFFSHKDKIYFYRSGKGSLAPYYNKASIGIFELRDYSKTTLEEVTTDTFEITESTYTQQNQTTLLVSANTTINLKLSKDWQGKELIVKKTGNFTCNIVPSGSETIDGVAGTYNFLGDKTSIALRALGGKIITYNK